MGFLDDIMRPRLTAAEIDAIERRYREARAANDISALTILAVEVFPDLIRAARSEVKP